jgi:hypothetical protein
LQALYGEDAGVESEQRDGVFITKLRYRVALPAGGESAATHEPVLL